LGIEIDSSFTFGTQTLKVGDLNRTLRKGAPRNVFIEAVSKIVLSIFLCAIEAWFPVAEQDQPKLKKVIKFAARFSQQLQ
jgi:hypothetical protein